MGILWPLPGELHVFFNDRMHKRALQRQFSDFTLSGQCLNAAFSDHLILLKQENSPSCCVSIELTLARKITALAIKLMQTFYRKAVLHKDVVLKTFFILQWI